MRIVTWNINSIRARIQLLRRLCEEVNPDVVCLQETKVVDELFPHAEIEDIFPFRQINGIKAYNGVAILSKRPFQSGGARNWCDRADGRYVFARFAGGLEIHNFYVPAGGDVPDPDENPKFAHKLDFVDEMTAYWTEHATARAKRVLVGDLNIAPGEHDVWSHKQLLDVVSHTPVEVDRMAKLQDSHGWIDVARHFVPADEKLYSWWSYRARDWRASNRGRRLDHVLVTPGLKAKLEGFDILAEARDWPKASDHVPVIVDLDA
ncbi:MAG: exodeoxyribonuclease III [Alphaproteobacteria bacterium]|jgi:exodeoxyribonuclease-3